MFFSIDFTILAKKRLPPFALDVYISYLEKEEIALGKKRGWEDNIMSRNVLILPRIRKCVSCVATFSLLELTFKLLQKSLVSRDREKLNINSAELSVIFFRRFPHNHHLIFLNSIDLFFSLMNQFLMNILLH